MSRRGLLAAAVAMSLAIGGVAVASQGPVAVTAGQKTYAKFTSIRSYKPSTLFFGAHEEIISMSWSTWGKTYAQGTGTYQVNNCLPDCADGTITPTPATVYLTGRIRCGKRFVFKRLKVFFAGQKRTSGAFCS